MATPPTRVSYNVPTSGNYSTVTTPKTTAAFDVVAGDLIVVLCSIEQGVNNTVVTPTASGGTVTWTSRASQTGGGTTTQSAAYCWTGAVGATATGITVSLARPSSQTTIFWGMSATVYRAHGGVGVAFSGNNATGSTAPSVAATCSANSAVVNQINDWNATDGTNPTPGRTWRTVNGSAQSEALYFRDATRQTVYGGFSPDTGTAGSITQGLTTPSTMRWVLVGVEILGTASVATARARNVRQSNPATIRSFTR